MKKYVLKYINGSEVYYACSVDHNGCTYSLVPDISKASKWYGKNATKQIESRIKADKRSWYGYVGEIVEIEEEPNWYFELQYAISQYDNPSKPIKKGFLKLMDECDKDKLINDHKKYPGYKNPDSITVNDLWKLDVEVLRRYYNWRKENFRGKPRVY
jgi:hypothetical protein